MIGQVKNVRGQWYFVTHVAGVVFSYPIHYGPDLPDAFEINAWGRKIDGGREYYSRGAPFEGPAELTVGFARYVVFQDARVVGWVDPRELSEEIP